MTLAFGTILDYVLKLRGISEIYEDSKLSGNELTMYYADETQGFLCCGRYGLEHLSGATSDAQQRL